MNRRDLASLVAMGTFLGVILGFMALFAVIRGTWFPNLDPDLIMPLTFTIGFPVGMVAGVLAGLRITDLGPEPQPTDLRKTRGERVYPLTRGHYMPLEDVAIRMVYFTLPCVIIDVALVYSLYPTGFVLVYLLPPFGVLWLWVLVLSEGHIPISKNVAFAWSGAGALMGVFFAVAQGVLGIVFPIILQATVAATGL